MKSAKLCVTTVASTRLNYCNIVLNKTSQSNLSKLQRAQNSIARVITNTRKRDHATLVLDDLHWLPIAACIDYKITILTFKSVVSRQPSYLCKLFDVHQSSRSLRSSSWVNCLTVNCCHTSFSSHDFCLAVWNYLPADLTNNMSSVVPFNPHMLKGVKLLPGHSFCCHFVTARS